MQINIKLRLNAVFFLVGMNMLLFLIPFLLSFVVFQGKTTGYYLFLDLLGALSRMQVVSGEVWRIVTSAFLHVDIFHLGANMLALWQLGMIVQEYYGSKLLYTFYILAGISGSVFTIVFLPQAASVGASGAVFGLLGVLVAGSLKNTAYGLNLPFRLWDILPIAIYSFLIGVIPGLPINNWAHLGGFLMGFVLGRVFNNRTVVWESRAVKFGGRITFYISLIMFVIAFIWMIFSLPGRIGI